MTTPTTNLNSSTLQQWLGRVAALEQQVRQWCQAQNWTITAQERRLLAEEGLPPYSVNDLRIATPHGDVLLEVVGMRAIGSDGRVDLLAWPSLNKVKLVNQRGVWQVFTDSNIPWPHPWNQQTFTELAQSLASSP